METITLPANPQFKQGQPLSYESTLCRLAGWWTMGESALTPREVALLQLDT